MPRRSEDVAQAEKICESRGDGTRHWRDGCLTHDKGVWPGERPDREARPFEEARVEREEQAVCELVLEELMVGVQLVPLELGRLVLTSLSNATNSARETLFAFSRNARSRWCLMTSSESVRLCSRWRHLPIWQTSSSERCSVSQLSKTSWSRCVCSLTFFCAACGALASAAGRFDGRMQTSKTWRRVSSGTIVCQSDRCMFVYGKGYFFSFNFFQKKLIKRTINMRIKESTRSIPFGRFIPFYFHFSSFVKTPLIC